jgi:hypothetical protein
MRLNRRQFLQLSVVVAASLSLRRLPVTAKTLPVTAVMTRRAGCVLIDLEMFRFIPQASTFKSTYIPMVKS